ncbi:hypothetical protein CMV_010890 [Castanea mollissima]|uniref:Uncharacterized protein n=1 Tax=Castanea mollissima TaxID=60419 RepID=A0A8J4VXF3_9ROSI|nr:hypothetical protein CMV_010890 [Castanea mollissima]
MGGSSQNQGLNNMWLKKLLAILATRIAYSGNKEFRCVVTLDGALFETSGTMSGGGSRPRGGKMGTSIQASSMSGEAVANAEKELSLRVEKLNSIRQRIAEAVWCYLASDKAVAILEMELAKIQKESCKHMYEAAAAMD